MTARRYARNVPRAFKHRSFNAWDMWLTCACGAAFGWRGAALWGAAILGVTFAQAYVLAREEEVDELRAVVAAMNAKLAGDIEKLAELKRAVRSRADRLGVVEYIPPKKGSQS